MALRTSKEEMVESDPMSRAQEVESIETADSPALSPEDVRHNVRVNVLVSAIFQIGAADMAVAAGPLLVYLGASNATIGLMHGMGWAALIGVFLSPFISVRCARKKWYMFLAHVPYIGAWGLIGALILFSKWIGISNEHLLLGVVALSAANFFFSGFVTLPSQEFLAACIPMSHRGRYTGYSMSVGAVGSLLSTSLGGYLLLTLEKPMSFGWLYVLFWVFAQGGYLLALYAREPLRRVALVAPVPWSGKMFQAFRADRNFQRVLLSNLLFFSVLSPCLMFVPIYGYRVLGLSAATAALIAIIQQVARLLLSSHIGILTDRFGAKRMLPMWFFGTALSVVPMLVWESPVALYTTVALQAICFAGVMSAFNPLLLGTPKPENRSGHYSVQIILRNLLDACGMVGTGILIDQITFIPYFLVWATTAFVMAFSVRRILSPLSTSDAQYS